jgi:hypothetical protein
MKLRQLVAVYDLEPIDAGEESESFHFRIEVLKDVGRKGQYFAQVLRRETYRMEPTFPIRTPRTKFLADHEVFVVDEMIGAENYCSTSKAAVIRKVESRIRDVFGKRSRNG